MLICMLVVEETKLLHDDFKSHISHHALLYRVGPMPTSIPGLASFRLMPLLAHVKASISPMVLGVWATVRTCLTKPRASSASSQQRPSQAVNMATFSHLALMAWGITWIHPEAELGWPCPF